MVKRSADRLIDRKQITMVIALAVPIVIQFFMCSGALAQTIVVSDPTDCRQTAQFRYILMSDTELYSHEGNTNNPTSDRHYKKNETWGNVRSLMKAKCGDNYYYDGLMIMGDLIYTHWWPVYSNVYAECFMAYIYGDTRILSDECHKTQPTLNISNRTYELMGNHDEDGQNGVLPMNLYTFVARQGRNGQVYSVPTSPHYAYVDEANGVKVHFLAINKLPDDCSNCGYFKNAWSGYTFMKNYLETYVRDSGEPVYIKAHADWTEWDSSPNDGIDNYFRTWNFLARYNVKSILHGHIGTHGLGTPQGLSTISYVESTGKVIWYNGGWVGQGAGPRDTSGRPNGAAARLAGKTGVLQQLYAQKSSSEDRLYQVNVSQAGGVAAYIDQRNIFKLIGTDNGKVRLLRTRQPGSNPWRASNTIEISMPDRMRNLDIRRPPASCTDIQNTLGATNTGQYTVFPKFSSKRVSGVPVICSEASPGVFRQTPDSKSLQDIKGGNVKRAFIQGGRYEQISQNEWHLVSSLEGQNGGAFEKYIELNRDEWSVYITNGNGKTRIDLFQKKVVRDYDKPTTATVDLLDADNRQIY